MSSRKLLSRRTFIRGMSAAGIGGVTGCLGNEAFPTVGGDDTNDVFRFAEVGRDRGLNYEYNETAIGTQKMIGNAGIYAVDFNRNGWTDLLLLGGKSPILFENWQGTYKKTNYFSSLSAEIWAALFFDYNNNGFDDLLLLPQGEEAIFFANENGHFSLEEVGLEIPFTNPVSAAAADYTGNGYPDVFVVQNGNWDRHPPRGLSMNSVPPEDDNGVENRLFTGNGSSFRESSSDAGITGTHWSLATSFVDFSGNGLPDIHVANDFNQDIIYKNKGDDTFERTLLGPETDRNGMSSAVADITGNSHLDIFVTNVWFPQFVRNRLDTSMRERAVGNNLLINDGSGGFVDEAIQYGVKEGGWGWAAIVEDLDNDGFLDIVHATQIQQLLFPDRRFSAEEIRDLHLIYGFYDHPAVFSGQESEFERKRANVLGFESTDGRGIAAFDFDGDGRLDIGMAQTGGTYHLYRNTTNVGRAIQIEVLGSESVTRLGTNVTVETPTRTLYQVCHSHSDFLSQTSRVLHFGVGNVTSVDITVKWQNGEEVEHMSVDTNQKVRIDPSGLTTLRQFHPPSE